MSVQLSPPITVDMALIQFLYELLRRAVDGTVPPLIVDYVNQRVIIGATSVSSGTAGKAEVTGDLKILGSANGVVLPDSGGSSRTYRLTVTEVTGESGVVEPVLSIQRVD